MTNITTISLATQLKTKTSIRGTEYQIRDYRTVGFFKDFDEAEKALNSTFYDLDECGYYVYAVLETYPEGIMAFAKNETWFKLNPQSGRFKPCEKPEDELQTINFAFG